LEVEKNAKCDEMIETKMFKEFLDIAVGYVKTMAFMDHDALVKFMSKAWAQWLDVLTIEGKMAKRKVTAMEADSKQAGTPAHEKAQKAMDAVERNRKLAMTESGKYRIAECLPLQPFLDDANFDATQEYKDYLERTKQG